MTQSKHTPWPWVVRETSTHVTVVGANGEVLFHDDKRIPLVLDDASLIAAAPELLEALQEMWDAHGSNTSGSLSKLVLDALTKATGANND